MKDLHWLTAGIVLLCFGFPAAAEPRTFTNREGKAITAEITTVREGKVFLKMGRQNYSVEITQLCDEDQKFLEDWVRNNFDYNLSFKATATELKDKRTSRRNGSKEKWETEFWRYDVEIVNRSGIDLENLTVDYRVVIRDERTEDPGRDRKTKTETARVLRGSTAFPKLAHTESESFSSMEATLPAHKWQVQRYETVYVSGQREVNYWWDNFDEESVLDGIWVRVYLQNRLIGEWQSQGKLIKAHQWPYEKKAAPVSIPDRPPEPDPAPKPRPMPNSQPVSVSTPTPTIPETPTTPPQESTPLPPPPAIGEIVGGNHVLSEILLSKRIQQKIQDLRQKPGDPNLIQEYEQLLDEQRRLIQRRQQS